MWQHGDRWPLALAIAILGGVVAWRSLAALAGASAVRRMAVLGCRTGFLLLLALLLLDPVAVRTEPRSGANEIIIAVDGARRLDVELRKDEGSFASQVREALSETAGWLKPLGETFRLRLVEIGEGMDSVTSGEELQFAANRTRMSDALQSWARTESRGALAGVVMFTDGNGLEPDPSEEGEETIPVFPVTPPEATHDADLSLRGIRVSQTPFEDTPVELTVQVSSTGWRDRSATLNVLAEDDRVLASENLDFDRDEQLRTVRVPVLGLPPGSTPLRVRIRGAGESDVEVTDLNNERRVTVDRGQGPYRVLYVAGRPNWEYKFLRRALRADDEVQLPSLVRIAKQEPKFEWRGREGEKSNPLFRGFGRDEEAIQRYDEPVLIRLNTRDAQELIEGFPKRADRLLSDYRVLILDDIEAAFFSAEQMRLIEDFVTRRGGTLIMLGGQESFRNGGYQGSLIGQMLPVYLDKVGQVTAMKDGRLELSREGLLEPWMRLRPEEEAEWKRMAEMPGFYSVNRTFSIKPAASLLASVTDAEGTKVPAWVTHRVGAGRVAAVLIGDLWRWGMKDQTAREDLERLWRQVLRWAVVDVPERVSLEWVTEGEERVISVRARDLEFHPADGADIRLSVKQGEETQTLYAEPSLTEPGVFEARYSSNAEGVFTVQAETSIEDPENPEETLVSKVESGWSQSPLAESMAVLTPDLEAMHHLAKVSGGDRYGVDQLDALAQRLLDLEAPVMDRRIEPLWHTPWVLALLLALLAAEWLLRRRSGVL